MFAGFWAIYKRELKAFAQSSSTYIVLGLLFLIVGLFYHQIMVQFVNDSAMAQAGGPFGSPTEAPNVTVFVVQDLFRLISAMILFTIPVLTMRLIAAERSRGTFEVLVTCPVGDWSIILGKYFALVTVGVALVVLSSVYPLTIYLFGRSQGAVPELPIVISCYLGLILIFSTYAAFGLMASSFTESQATAAVVTLIGLLLWNSIGEFSIPDQRIQRIVSQLSAANHTEPFLTGLLTGRDIAFFVLTSFAFLFAAARVLEARRWRI